MSTQRRHTAHKHTLAFWIMWRARWMTPSAFIWSRRCRNIQLSNWCECSVCDWVDGIRKRFSICCCRIACAIAVLPHLPVFALTKHRRQIALQTSNFKRNDGVTFSGWMRDRFFQTCPQLCCDRLSRTQRHGNTRIITWASSTYTHKRARGQ